MGRLLEHITALDPNDFLDLEDVDTPTLLAAQAGTAAFLTQLGAEDEALMTADQAHLARQAFAAVTSLDTADAKQRDAIMALKVPAAVRHLAGMLSEYDWDFVEQAKQLRGYVVAKLLEETKNPDARIRLRALELTGKITEVAAFTERSEVVHTSTSADELEARIRAKLATLLPAASAAELQPAEDVVAKDIGGNG